MSELPRQPERLEPNDAQAATLQRLCDGYRVEYSADHYLVYSPDSFMMPGWAEGWIGGEPGTIYVGVSPEGEAHS